MTERPRPEQVQTQVRLINFSYWCAGLSRWQCANPLLRLSNIPYSFGRFRIPGFKSRQPKGMQPMRSPKMFWGSTGGVAARRCSSGLI